MAINTKMTSGKLITICRIHLWGNHVLDQVERRECVRIGKVNNKIQHDELTYIKNCTKADAVITANQHQADDAMKWKKDHILDFIRSLEMEGDEAMSLDKLELYQRYLETRNREQRISDPDVVSNVEACFLLLEGRK